MSNSVNSPTEAQVNLAWEIYKLFHGHHPAEATTQSYRLHKPPNSSPTPLPPQGKLLWVCLS